MVSKISKPLSGMTVTQITQALPDLPSYRAKQLFSWIARGACSFDQMTNLPHELRKKLADSYAIRKSAISKTLKDKDGTVKLRLELEDGAAIETVLLRTDAADDSSGATENKSRFTACLSTQAGCPIGCVFCKTGALGFKRNLEVSEITEQFLFLSDIAHKEGKNISNIVIMGMGEPLLNLNSLRSALDILCDSRGVHLSRRKITVSTSGICSGILEMAEHGPQAELALSLNSAREDLRNSLMPGVRNEPLAEVKKALRLYRKKQGRRITVEMVLLKGINTGSEEAASVGAFAKDLGALVNLIPWNPVEGLRFEGKPLQTPEEAEIEQFRVLLEQQGLTVTRRYRRGRGIGGACGQLGA
jgi:23S rRNA (adenine2503-C2)-methyltransferase